MYLLLICCWCFQRCYTFRVLQLAKQLIPFQICCCFPGYSVLFWFSTSMTELYFLGAFELLLRAGYREFWEIFNFQRIVVISVKNAKTLITIEIFCSSYLKLLKITSKCCNNTVETSILINYTILLNVTFLTRNR